VLQGLPSLNIGRELGCKLGTGSLVFFFRFQSVIALPVRSYVATM
jgi:hypothetical protein